MYVKCVLFTVCVLFMAGCTVHRGAGMKTKMLAAEETEPADHDRDGVLDRDDRCPSEPETKNGYKDGDGCPDEMPSKPVLKSIHYGVNSKDIGEENKATIADAAKVLQQYPQMWIRIEGHTDSYGAPSYNLDISRRRAESVKSSMVKMYGIEPSRIETAGYGMTRPIDSFNTKEGRIANRRIDFVITAGWPPAE